MSDQPTKHSVEHYGLGQSGYTAGRVAGDPSLAIRARNLTYPKDADEGPPELGEDERFTGEGGPPWAPDENDPVSRPVR